MRLPYRGELSCGMAESNTEMNPQQLQTLAAYLC